MNDCEQKLKTALEVLGNLVEAIGWRAENLKGEPIDLGEDEHFAYERACAVLIQPEDSPDSPR